MNSWQFVQVEIPKELYDRIDRFAVVEKAIISEMTEWVEIMEDEERLAEEDEEKPRFRVILRPEALLPNCEVINNYERDRDNDFVGTFQGISNKECLLTIAEEGYGISEDEIEFVEY